VALTICALIAERIAAHGSQTILRKKDRGIWHAVTWTQLGAHLRENGTSLKAIGFRPGEVACVIAETRLESVYVDLAILGVGGVSAGIHPATEAEALGDALRQAECRVLFVENEEQLDKALLVRERCPALRRIVIFDIKGLRDFADPMCESLSDFVSRGAAAGDDWVANVTEDQPAILLLPQGRLLTHGDAMHLIANARNLLKPQVGDERLALLPMSQMMERVFGLYLSLDARAISNYLENPDTVMENLQEVKPTLLGTDRTVWEGLYARASDAASGATRLQRSLYRAALAMGGPLARFCVLRAVRRELGLSRLRRAYIGSPLPPDIEHWAQALGITIQQIDGQATQGIALDARYRALMEEAYGT
jgi:long-chain acyl-CoA synthetase